MKKQFLVILFFAGAVLCSSARAQIVVSGNGLADINGRPVFETTYTHVEGSPYLIKEWTAGIVKMANGATYKDMQLKYDMVAGIPLFMNTDGSPLKFVDDVLEFKLSVPEVLFRNGYKPVDNNTSKTYYQVLFDGGVSLIKEEGKTISETKTYNSASVIRKFLSFEGYYLVRDNQPFSVRKSKKTILSALGTKTEELEKFIETNKLDLKQEKDMVRLIEYYNSM